MAQQNPLWHGINNFYALPGVESLCLTLQNEHHLRIIWLLGAAWLARQGCQLPPHWLDATWSLQVIEPLRAVRREVRRQVLPAAEMPPVYALLKQAELAAERYEVDRLWQRLGTPLPVAAIPEATLLVQNLLQAAQTANPQLCAAGQQQLTRLANLLTIPPSTPQPEL